MVDIFPSLSYFLGRFWSSSVCTLCLPICWVQCLPGWLSSSSSSSVCCQRSFWWSFASPEAPIHDRYTHPSLPFPLWILPFYHIHPILCYSPDLLTLLFFFHLTPCPNQAWRDSVTANKKIFDGVLYGYVKQDLGPVWAEKCLWVAGLYKNWFTWKSDNFYYLLLYHVTPGWDTVTFFFELSITSLPLVYPYQPNLTLFDLLRSYFFSYTLSLLQHLFFFTSPSLSWITPLTFFLTEILPCFKPLNGLDRCDWSNRQEVNQSNCYYHSSSMSSPWLL